ncbi:hypothetical protein [Chitinophaga nivalis]|uniref:Uncharacterized protein n=1 Tax=Chitinophaga nivalis TaxID=2991709 RepID=A0ABT3IM79_9BACT|nr:hypothetical protein [Chitinophaga nivalis]MCW3465237.1 hypothetical protein [Chitinophaga nivalis]MCW3485071.1 hypothetical protein [Chitinophaga nivalis]
MKKASPKKLNLGKRRISGLNVSLTPVQQGAVKFTFYTRCTFCETEPTNC